MIIICFLRYSVTITITILNNRPHYLKKYNKLVVINVRFFNGKLVETI